MKTTFSIQSENGRELLLVDHHFFYDLLNPAYSENERRQIERAIKNFVPQRITEARKINSKYKLFIGKYAINTLKLANDPSFKRVVNAYLDNYMDYFETAPFFQEKQDPAPDDIAAYELEFYRHFTKDASNNGCAVVLLTGQQSAAQRTDRLIDTGLARVISFSPEHGFVEYKKVEPQEGDVVYCNGATVPLLHRFGSGGEADIFEIAPGKLAKIYKTGLDMKTHLPNCYKFQDDMRLRNERLDVLLTDSRYQLNDRYIVLPQYKLTDANGNLTGIVMDQVEGIPLVDIITKNQYPFKNFKRSDLLTIAKKIITKFKKLHTHGMIMGDINLENILVDAKSPDDIKIYIIDLDSCQIEGFPSTFEKPEFTDPVWLQKREQHGFIPRTIENECFTLMVLLFNILFNNVHPYQHPTARNLEDSTRKRLYPYKIKEKDIEFIQKEFGVEVAMDRSRNEKKAPSLPNYTHSHLPRYMKCLFYLTFAEQGKDFRPSTTQMMKAIERYISYLKENPESDKIVYDNFAIAKEEQIHFTCSSKSCQKPYYYHYGKVLTHFRTNDPYLYCDTCISLYDTQIKKLLTDESIPEQDRLSMKKEWEASLNRQRLDILLHSFLQDSSKSYRGKERITEALGQSQGQGAKSATSQPVQKPVQPKATSQATAATQPKAATQSKTQTQPKQQPKQPTSFLGQLFGRFLGN